MPRKKRSVASSSTAQPLTMAGILDPAMLLLQRRGPLHGYGLISGLRAMVPANYAFDASAAYRTLRRLEQEGMVVSDLDHQGSLGPRRRVYQITPGGIVLLSRWMADLLATCDLIVRLLEESEAQRRGLN